MKIPVNLVALGSGVSMGYLGNSHFGLEDISIMRSIPGLNISCPADCGEMGKMLNDYASNNLGPSYIRLTGVPGSAAVYEKDYLYKFGKIVTLTTGKDLLILATGSMVAQSLKAYKILKDQGIEATVVNVHTLKPLFNGLEKKIKEFKYVVTVEEHSIIGGLNSIISEMIVKNKLINTFLSISLPDKFGPTGTYDYLLNYHGLTGNKIAKKINNWLKKNS